MHCSRAALVSWTKTISIDLALDDLVLRPSAPWSNRWLLASMAGTARSSAGQPGPEEIVRLPSRAKHELRSYLALPTLPSILSALVHNALEADSKRIDVHLCISTEEDGAADLAGTATVGPPPCITCVDDGKGFDREIFGCKELWSERTGTLDQLAGVGMLSITTGSSRSRWTHVRKVRNLPAAHHSGRSWN